MIVPGPRPLPAPSGPFGDPPFKWDVFLSYRSVDRRWAMALYDQLVAANFRVFMDQFVLHPGVDLGLTLAEALSKSASGVLVLSEASRDASWVRAEYTKMHTLREQRKSTNLPFNYVIARIDTSQLPFEDQTAIYTDFSSGYEDGPRGVELLRLVHGLGGTPLPEQTVRAALAADEKMKDLLLELKAAHVNGDHEAMLALLRSDAAELRESPAITAFGAEELISAGREQAALELLREAEKLFPRSLRLQQLEGLALRRLAGQVERSREQRQELLKDAQRVLGRLYAAEHRDSETLGIYAATWFVRFELTGERSYLERSRTLYQEAFEITPKDAYVGINAASKSALLGDLGLARELAGRVGPLVSDFADGSDFYKACSLAEALLLLGRYEESAAIYKKARGKHPQKVGHLQGTRAQVEALIVAIGVSDSAAAQLRQAVG